jgi:hypothetical protein
MIHGIEACFHPQLGQEVGGHSGGSTQDLTKLPKRQLCQECFELVAQSEVANSWLESWRVAEEIQECRHHIQRVMNRSGEASALRVPATPSASGSPLEEFVRGEPHKLSGPGEKLAQASLVYYTV